MLQAMGLGSWPAAEAMEADEARQHAPADEAVLAQAAPVIAPTSTPSVATASSAAWPDLPSLHEAVGACRACGLCEQRRQAVPGVGAATARWMVVGEAPGEQEDASGEPFVGPSGQLLDSMLAAVGRSRRPGGPEEQVFITNTVKCRPPGNRNPAPEEMAACAGFLRAQIALVKPKLILAFGRFAAKALLHSDAPLGSLRGRAHALPDGTAVVVSYHPSYLLRQPAEKARAWEDLCLALDLTEAMEKFG